MWMRDTGLRGATNSEFESGFCWDIVDGIGFVTATGLFNELLLAGIPGC